MKLAGKVAIVTGTSPNIGGGIAEGLADEGASVVCVDQVAENAQQCAESIKRRGGQALGVTWILGGLSVLEMELERWNRQLAVNLTGTFLCTKHAARLMVADGRRGSIIVIVSTAGHQGQAGNIGYCTSKSGLLNFTRAAAMDLAKHGIRVNSLTPTATDRAEAAERAVAWGRPRPERREGAMLDFQKMVPAGRLPSPHHYARAAVFLASDDAEMVTGFDLRVDGGAIAKYWPWVPNA